MAMRGTYTASYDSMIEVPSGSLTNLAIMNNTIGDISKNIPIDTQLQKVNGSRYAV